MVHDFLSSEDVMGIGIGEGSTPEQLGKENPTFNDTNILDGDINKSVWDE
jgi:hypothetical protein